MCVSNQARFATGWLAECPYHSDRNAGRNKPARQSTSDQPPRDYPLPNRPGAPDVGYRVPIWARKRCNPVAGLVILTLGLITVATGVRSAVAEARAPREIFLSETRLDTLKQRVERRIEPTYSAWLDLKSRAEGLLDRQPHAPEHWYVPGYYRDATGHSRAKQGLQDDANAVYELALCWRMTGEERYARSAVRLIDGWVNTVQSTSQKDDSTLSFSYHFPPMIFGADLLASWPGFSDDQQDAFRRFCRETAMPLNTMNRSNNWGNWGLVLVLACARYLDDDTLLNRGEQRWKEFLDQQIDNQGHLHHEVHRSGGMRGIWYSHFSLFPQTIAAEILRVAGRDR